jgi:hypothetical protein
MSGIAARLRQQTRYEQGSDAAVMTFNERFNAGRIRTVFLALMGAVGFVLLIACERREPVARALEQAST